MDKPKSKRILEWLASHSLWEIVRALAGSGFVGTGVKYVLKTLHDPAIGIALILIGIYFLVPLLSTLVHRLRLPWANYRTNDIPELKKDLREIARRFPGNAFVKRPTDRMNWSPLIGSPETGLQGNELELAIKWHDKFERLFPASGRGPDYANMSWDETFAFLDREERKRRGLPV